MKLRFFSAAIAFVLVTTLQTLPSQALPTKDFTVPATYVLTKCASAVEFDCIESAGIVDGQGNFKAGSLAYDQVADNPRIENGNKIYDGSSAWRVDSRSIYLTGTLDSPVTKGCAGTCAALRIHVDVDNPLTTKVRLIFRTSWIRPMNIQMKSLDSDYKYEKIPGGVRWTMEGMGMPFSTYWPKNNEELESKYASNSLADSDSTFFDFYIHHAGNSVSESFWDPMCSDKGFSVQSHNTNETGDPMWDAANESLIFSIRAPHFKKSGDLNVGFFKYWASHAFMDCKYPGNTLTKAAKLTLEIINEDGTSSVATSAVMNKDGTMYFFASGFHFSTPKILIKAEKVTPAATPAPSPSASASVAPVVAKPKSVTISCIKGKLLKKISGVNPKCPTGYKKK
jgi:hypothetical protein